MEKLQQAKASRSDVGRYKNKGVAVFTSGGDAQGKSDQNGIQFLRNNDLISTH